MAGRAIPRAERAGRGIRVLFPAHPGLVPGGIGAVTKGLAANIPEVIGSLGTLVVALPEADRRLSALLPQLTTLGAAARLGYEQVNLPRIAADFDLVHLCDIRPILLSRTPFLITVHDLNFLDRPEGMPAMARHYKTRMLRAALLKRPAAVVCSSHYTRGRLLHHFPNAARGELRVIYPGVDEVERSWTGAGDPPYFLTVSTITPRKNHLGLLRAFRQARDQGLKARWVVAGPRGLASREIVETLETEPGVEFVGQVPDGELDRLYRDALFLATPSALEGFGYPPLEAMLRGVPTLTSSAGSLAEVIDGAGPLVAPDDVGAWARALVWLAEDAEARRELSGKGRERSQQFSWRRSAESTVRLYRDICG